MNEPMVSLCPCGSGLRPSRCCDLELSKRGLPAASRHLAPIVERAMEAWRAGDKKIAEQLCLEVLELSPDRPGALSLLYEIRKAEGAAKAAGAIVRRIVALDPNNFAATNEVTLLLLAAGNLVEAETHARNAIRIAPRNPQSHNLMGMLMTEAQRASAGEYHYRRALELGARDPILVANLAWNLKGQGRVDEARALYREAVAAAPDAPQILLGWARLEEADRQLDAAHAQLDALAALAPDNPAMRLVRAAVLGRQQRVDEALAELDAAAGDNGTLGAMELLDKGRLLDQVGRYDEAWAAFEAGKARGRDLSGNVYAADVAQDMASRLRGFFVASRLSTLPRAGVRTDAPQPIFILGFPRSGTTLMEQTLSATPRICAGDELPLIHDIANLMPRMLGSPLAYPEALTELWMGDQREGLDNLRDYYLQKVRQMGVLRPDAAYFTDKMPLNEMHLGLIALVFPQAPLIHMIRHPLDVMVSAMANHFTHGYFCASALETAARHYVLVSELVEHYRAQAPPRYLLVRYEDVVDDQEATVRAVFDFIGEPFDPSVLHFERNARYARTASYAQVTEKLYDRSRYRYRHYLRQLEPVRAILEPVIEQLGYVVDEAL